MLCVASLTTSAQINVRVNRLMTDIRTDIPVENDASLDTVMIEIDTVSGVSFTSYFDGREFCHTQFVFLETSSSDMIHSIIKDAGYELFNGRYYCMKNGRDTMLTIDAVYEDKNFSKLTISAPE